MSLYELTIAAIVAISTAVAIVAVAYAIEQRGLRLAAIKRAEMAETWADEYQRTACELQQRLTRVERMHANLQAVYASMVRVRLAQSMPVLEYYAARRKQRK